MPRSTYLTLHRWLALTFAPLLFLQALTGTVLLFHAPLARMIDHVDAATTQAPVSKLAASAQASGSRLDRLFLPAESGDIALAQMSNPDGETRYAALDPASGNVLREGSIIAFPLEATLQLHYRLLSGTTGLAIVMVNGLALSLLAGTGLTFWWPGRGRFRKSLEINARMPGRIRLRQWHRTGGVLASLLLVFSATTGILLSAPDVLASTKGTPTEAEHTPASGEIDAAVALAQAEFPEARLRDIRFPRADRIDINFFAPERNSRAVHSVSARLSRPELFKVLPAEQNGVLWMVILPLHSGDIAGLAGQLLLLAEALVLIALALSGPWMWWQRRRRQK